MLIGATHNINTVFWEEGGLATTGIEQMAETGGTTSFSNEINNSIDLGDSKLIIRGSGYWWIPWSSHIHTSC